ncbi:hypothetical protein AURDEDRAFT_127568 [Auricularia subglabra TFB-10046 SS5]|nr:hypothetical protein AURDEDRAFT_127568 [Auricularia subglabra TFB-10046 SS5]
MPRPANPARIQSSESPSDDDDDDDSDDDDGPDSRNGARAHKRQTYDPAAAPFRSSEFRASNPISAHVARTLAIRANYCLDLRAAKQDLLRDGRAPPLPEDLWEHVLANRAVDFDKILSARFEPSIPDGHTRALGDDAFFVTGEVRPKRKVANRSAWLECWDTYAEAVCYAYPHRTAELRTYQRLVSDLFNAIHETRHRAVIKADIVMRNEVALNRTWSFFDEDKLSRVHMRHTHSWGSGTLADSADADTKPARKPKGPRAESSGEICNNFNDRVCKYDKCRHLHVCRICQRKDHGAADHLDAVRKEAEAGTRARIARAAGGGGGSPQ